jgi:hypothetical protein
LLNVHYPIDLCGVLVLFIDIILKVNRSESQSNYEVIVNQQSIAQIS